jgi:hypothetical protein
MFGNSEDLLISHKIFERCSIHVKTPRIACGPAFRVPLREYKAGYGSTPRIPDDAEKGEITANNVRNVDVPIVIRFADRNIASPLQGSPYGITAILWNMNEVIPGF